MKKAEIYFKNVLAGILEENESGYEFSYLKDYLESRNPEPVSLTLPLSETPHSSKVLFPFFDGLIPEGWLLDIALKNTDISSLDRMSLLLLCCKDCIGAVSVVPIKEENYE